MKKSGKMSTLLLGFVKLTGILPALIFFKPKVHLKNENSKRKLPKKAILMSNHKSLLDFVLYLVIFPFRSIHFLMAEVLFNKGKLFSWFLYKLGGIFVDRDACNFSFVENSLEVLDSGGTVGIFPQGRISAGNNAYPFKPGIVLVALRTDAPIIPIYTKGGYGIFKRAHVMIGEEIYLSSYTGCPDASPEELRRLAKILEDKTYELKNELEKRLESENGR